MPSERELNLLIKARDEASRVFARQERNMERMERAMYYVGDGAGDVFGRRYPRYLSQSERAMYGFMRSSIASLDEYPKHLQQMRSELKWTESSIGELSAQNIGIDKLAGSLEKTSISAKKLTSLSDSGKKAAQIMTNLKEQTKAAQLAVMGLQKNGKVQISAAEAHDILREFRTSVEDAKARLIELRDAGDFGSFQAGMYQLQQSIRNVDRAMGAANTGGMAYYSMLSRLGVHTSNMANMMGIMMEGYRDRFMRSVDMMMAKSTQSDKLSQNIEKFGAAWRGIDQQFLKISNGLERIARNGMPAVVALNMLGPTASMKDLYDQIKLINQGIMRFQSVALVSGIATIGMVYGLTLLSNTIDGRLIPAFEYFKTVWLKALEPLAHAFTEIGLAVINFGTSIGVMMANLAQAHPLITGMIEGFVALLPLVIFLAAPMAILGVRMGSLAVAFRTVWTFIGPFVTGLMSIIGTVMLITGAIVGLVAVFYQLWTSSDQLQRSIQAGFGYIQSAILLALSTIQPAFEQLKAAFVSMVSVFVGGGDSMTSIWKKIGDAIGIYFIAIVNAALPVIRQIFLAIANVVITVINQMIQWIHQLSYWWQAHGQDVQVILNAIMTVIRTVFGIIVSIVQFVWPLIFTIIKGVWDNIVGVVQGATGMIGNIILIFSNLLQGNWSGLWEAVKGFVTSALEFVWNFIQLWGLGRVLKFFGSLGVSLVNTVIDFMGKIKGWFVSKFDEIMSWLIGIREKFISIGLDLMEGFARGITNGMSRVVSAITNTVKSAIAKAKSLLKIHSPSKVFGEIGDNTMLGFANSVDKAKSLVTKAMERTVSAATQVASGMNISSAGAAIAGSAGSGSGSQTTIINFEAGAFVLPNVTNGQQLVSEVNQHIGSLRQAFKSN